jgi:hypothetical protein
LNQIEEKSMKQHLLTSALGCAAIVTIITASGARADVIVGPMPINDDVGYHASGLGFTATVSTTLTSFTFNNQGLADTVVLVDPLGNILDSATVPSGAPFDTLSVNWSLTAGNTYFLLQTTQSNSLYGPWGLAPPSDGQIALIDTGVFSCGNPPACIPTELISADFAGAGNQFWAAFTNIATASSVPEPASFGLLLLGAVAMVWRAKIPAGRPRKTSLNYTAFARVFRACIRRQP